MSTIFANKEESFLPDASLSVVRIKCNFNFLFTYNYLKKNILNLSKLFQPKIIKRYGYPAESHIVDTKDGYLLEVHRIPHGKNNRRYKNFPVFLQHGVVASSADWIINGPSKALGKF